MGMLLMKKNIEGCLIGCGVGDTLGLPLEFLTKKQVLKRFPQKLRDFIAPVRHKYCSHMALGQYSDDTQLTIAIAKSIIDSKAINIDDIVKKHIEAFNEKPLRGWGPTTTNALEKLANGKSWQETGLPSAGTGPSMKISPVGLFYHLHHEKIFEACKNIGLMTHTDPRALVSSAVTAYAISYTLNHRNDFEKNHFIDTLINYAKDCEAKLGPTEEYLSNKLQIVKKSLEFDSGYLLEKVGARFYVLEAVPFSLGMFAMNPYDFEETLIETVNSGGDTDTNGSIVGALLGTFNGIDEIPDRWKTKLENYEMIKNLGSKLYEVTKTKKFSDLKIEIMG